MEHDRRKGYIKVRNLFVKIIIYRLGIKVKKGIWFITLYINFCFCFLFFVFPVFFDGNVLIYLMWMWLDLGRLILIIFDVLVY